MSTVDLSYALTAEWLFDIYGIRWDGAYNRLGGKLAQVLKIHDQATDKDVVVRLSDPARITPDRLLRTHLFQEHLREKGVLTPIPRMTRNHSTCAIHSVSGRLVEVLPFVPGRHPIRGSTEDAIREGQALARFHNAGLGYLDLPGEESCDQNHVALHRLRKSVELTRDILKHTPLDGLASRYLGVAEDLIGRLESMRNELVESALHLDASPENILFADDGQEWFLDLSHAARGRRVFDVVTAMYYLHSSSVAEVGEASRYGPGDPDLESGLLKAYQRACEPDWTEAEDQAILLERRLMLIHGITYWAETFSEERFRDELTRFASYWESLKRAT